MHNHPQPPNRLRELREAKGMKQASIAHHCQVDQGTVVRWEKRQGPIAWRHVLTLSELLGVTPAYLLGLTDDDHATEAA